MAEEEQLENVLNYCLLIKEVMSKRCSPILTLSVKLILLSTLLALCACGKSNLDMKTETMKRGIPDETSNNVTLTEYEQNRIAYILNAERIERYYDRRILNAYKVEIEALDKKTGGTSVLKADSTIVDEARNMILAYGNVQLMSAEGSIFTNRMIWDRNSDVIVAPDTVMLVRAGNILRGKNLRTNLSIYPTEMDSISAEGLFEEKEFLNW